MDSSGGHVVVLTTHHNVLAHQPNMHDTRNSQYSCDRPNQQQPHLHQVHHQHDHHHQQQQQHHQSHNQHQHQHSELEARHRRLEHQSQQHMHLNGSNTYLTDQAQIITAPHHDQPVHHTNNNNSIQAWSSPQHINNVTSSFPQQQNNHYHNDHYQQRVSCAQQQQHATARQARTTNTVMYSSAVAPPTPPSDEPVVSPSNCRLASYTAAAPVAQDNGAQTTAWVLQAVARQQHHHNQPAHVNNQLMFAEARQQQQHQSAQHQSDQRATAIANYFYDIDDGFSDILSAPPTPEPIGQVQLYANGNNQASLHQQPHQTRHQQQQQQQQPQYLSTSQHDSYVAYLSPFDTNQQQHPLQQQVGHHQQQVISPQQHQQQQTAMYADMSGSGGQPYAVAMSPDSSSLSTTSSTPSDHSLYQLSPPAVSLTNCVAASQQQQQRSMHVQQQQQQQQQQHYAQQRLLVQTMPSPNAMQPQSQADCGAPIKREPTTAGVLSTCLIAPSDASFGNAPTKTPTQQRTSQTAAALSKTATAATAVRQNAVPACRLQQQHPPQHRSSPIHLWEFLKELLHQVDAGCADVSVIRWLDRQKGVFKIEDSVKVAKLWGKRKNKPKMNYDKLSRSIRQYYKKGIMKKTDRSQRLVYQFCPAYCH